jgi:hypothetical protein
MKNQSSDETHNASFPLHLVAWSASFNWSFAQEDSLMTNMPENKPVKNTFKAFG